MTTILKKPTTWACQQCGRCCKKYRYTLAYFTRTDWLRLLPYVQEKYGGLLRIKDEFGYTYEVDFFDIDDYDIAHEDSNLLWEALDIGLCPFLTWRKDRNTGKRLHHCEVQAIKPDICRKYRCVDDIRHGEQCADNY